MAFVATAPLVIAKNDQGGDLYIYRDGRIPDGQDETWVEQMLKEGLISEVDDAEAPDKPPPGNADRETWLTYALAHGVTAEEAADMDRNALRDRFK